MNRIEAINKSKHCVAFRLDKYKDCIYSDSTNDIWYNRSGSIVYIDDNSLSECNDWDTIENKMKSK